MTASARLIRFALLVGPGVTSDYVIRRGAALLLVHRVAASKKLSDVETEFLGQLKEHGKGKFPGVWKTLLESIDAGPDSVQFKDAMHNQALMTKLREKLIKDPKYKNQDGSINEESFFEDFNQLAKKLLPSIDWTPRKKESDEKLHSKAINEGMRELFTDREFEIPIPGGQKITVNIAQFLPPESYDKIMKFDAGGAGEVVNGIPVQSIYSIIRSVSNKMAVRHGQSKLSKDAIFDIANSVVTYLLSESFFREMQRKALSEVEDVVENFGPLHLFEGHEAFQHEIERRYNGLIENFSRRAVTRIEEVLRKGAKGSGENRAAPYFKNLRILLEPKQMLRKITSNVITAGYGKPIIEAWNEILTANFNKQFVETFGGRGDEISVDAVNQFLEKLRVRLLEDLREFDVHEHTEDGAKTTLYYGLIGSILENSPRYRQFFEDPQGDPRKNLHNIFDLSKYFFGHMANRVRNAYQSHHGRKSARDIPASRLEEGDEENRDFSEIVGATSQVFDKNFHTLFSLFQHYILGEKPDYVDQEVEHKQHHDNLWKKVVSKLAKPKGWTDRNALVFQYLLDGMNQREIAEKLGAAHGIDVSPGAISNNDIWKIRSAWIKFVDDIIKNPEGQQLITGASSDQTIRDTVEKWEELLKQYGEKEDPRAERILKSTSRKIASHASSKMRWFGHAVSSYFTSSSEERFAFASVPLIRFLSEASK